MESLTNMEILLLITGTFFPITLMLFACLCIQIEPDAKDTKLLYIPNKIALFYGIGAGIMLFVSAMFIKAVDQIFLYVHLFAVLFVMIGLVKLYIKEKNERSKL